MAQPSGPTAGSVLEASDSRRVRERMRQAYRTGAAALAKRSAEVEAVLRDQANPLGRTRMVAAAGFSSAGLGASLAAPASRA